jgi:hypothetical protein
MNDSNLTPPPDQEKVTPGRCLLGSAISAALGFGVYSLSKAIAVSSAHTPVTSDNPLVIRITVAVRTLVLGVSSLATFVLGFVALGLILLAIQLIVQGISKKSTSEP